MTLLAAYAINQIENACAETSMSTALAMMIERKAGEADSLCAHRKVFFEKPFLGYFMHLQS